MKAIWLAFGAVFLAELGDKTQLAILAMRSKGFSGLGLFFGAMLAFATLTALAILVGGWLQTKVPEVIITKIAAGGFVVIGVLMWFSKV
ncbi:MAG: TMEM165/GDT1 family protein [Candidatus Neomarinimicrobiota bacterium]